MTNKFSTPQTTNTNVFIQSVILRS